jgi:hypothetical protein
VHGDKKSSAKGRLHAETILTKDEKRKVELVYGNDILFICDVQNADAVAGIKGCKDERDRLRQKKDKSGYEQERLHELSDTISREEKHQAIEQVGLAAEAIRKGMKVISLTYPPELILLGTPWMKDSWIINLFSFTSIFSFSFNFSVFDSSWYDYLTCMN